MGLFDEYEDRCSSILNQTPTLSFETALVEMKSEETRKRAVASLTLPPGSISSHTIVVFPCPTSSVLAAAVTDTAPSIETSSFTKVQLTSDELAVIAQLHWSLNGGGNVSIDTDSLPLNHRAQGSMENT
ncbi:hypothetical protein JCGZ_02410 [Jatropha curcas]|uniref:Uncharacterized protein n=1 Tax=Jatropha curcas TaxID=180498 RepID=A0A067LQU3_JATCU|nr:hypothetical protein JCGZ_02410 [Jatropha curcas]